MQTFLESFSSTVSRENLFYKSFFQSKWSQSIHHGVLCAHTGGLVRIGCFKAGGVTTAGVQGTAKWKNRWHWAGYKAARFPYSVCSIHLVLGVLLHVFLVKSLLISCTEKVVQIFVKVELLVLKNC